MQSRSLSASDCFTNFPVPVAGIFLGFPLTNPAALVRMLSLTRDHTMPHVTSGSDYMLRRKGYDEDGWAFEQHDTGWFVSFVTDDGIEYTHLWVFWEGESRHAADRASALARRVQAQIDTQGVDSLDPTMWATRIVYGSEVYQREEGYIVERERADALLA